MFYVWISNQDLNTKLISNVLRYSSFSCDPKWHLNNWPKGIQPWWLGGRRWSDNRLHSALVDRILLGENITDMSMFYVYMVPTPTYMCYNPDSWPRSVPALELHSRAASRVGVTSPFQQSQHREQFRRKANKKNWPKDSKKQAVWAWYSDHRHELNTEHKQSNHWKYGLFIWISNGWDFFRHLHYKY